MISNFKLIKPLKNSEYKSDRSTSLPGFHYFEKIKLKKEKKLNGKFIYNKISNYNLFEKNLMDSKILKKYFNKINKRQLSNKLFSNSLILNNKINISNFNSSSSSFLNSKRRFSKISPENDLINNENEELTKIKNEVNILWDNLCVVSTYKEIFNVLISQLDLKEKIIFYKYEKKSLNLFKDILLEIKNNIKDRNYCILELKNLNKELPEILKSKSPKSNEEIFENISNEIQKLRKCTINIVNSLINFKKEIHFSLEGKYNINKLEKKFSFDKNYLIKMKEELNFIKDGYIKFFFDVNNDNSPFLIKSSEINGNEFFLRKVPITKDEREEINKCHFLIYQDLIFYQKRNYYQGNIFRKISPIKKCINDLIINSENKKQIKGKNNSEETILKKIDNLKHKFRNDIDKKYYTVTNFKNKLGITNNFNSIMNKNEKYIISFYKNSINQFQNNYYKEYFQKIPNEQIEFFNINSNIINNFKNKIFPCLILLEYNSKLLGICIVNYFLQGKNLKLRISHLSSIDNENYKKIFSDLIEFVKNEFIYDEIEILGKMKNDNLYNIFNKNCFILEDDILKFKSKCLIDDKKKESISNLINKNIFGFIDIMIITDYENNPEIIKKNKEHNKNINLTTYNYLMDNSENKNLLNIYNNMIYEDMLKYFISNDFDQKEFPLIFNNNNLTFKSCYINNDILINHPLFNSFNFSCLIDEIYYNYISLPFSILKNNKYNINIYEISIGNLYLMIFELSKELNMILNSNNIYIQLHELYTDVILLENKNEEKLLWVPCFDINSHYFCNEFSILKNTKNFFINEFIKIYNKNIEFNEEIICMKKKHKIPYVNILQNINSDIIIKNNFIVSIIDKNNKVQNFNSINIIFTVKIKTEQFIKNTNK